MAKAPRTQPLACDEPSRRRRLAFRPKEDLAHVGDPIAADVSALAVVGRTLFAACDETSTIERLVLDDEREAFTDHSSFALGDIFDLPGGADGEMDIEGLAVDGGHLWATGSHSLKRDTPDEDADADAALGALGTVSTDPNRHFLGRVPLIERAPGIFEPVREIAPADGPARVARMVRMRGASGRTIVKRMLSRDPLLAPFMTVPCKENGFDVEGLAVRGERVILGLRGPVIGLRAVLIEMRMKETASGFLKPRRLASGARYARHLVDLDGFGIRDLLLDGDDLLILAGPVADIDGIQGVYRLPGAFGGDLGPVLRRDALERILRLPIREGCDHAEGLALLDGPEAGRRELLVAYDSPAPDRREGAGLDIDCHQILRRAPSPRDGPRGGAEDRAGGTNMRSVSPVPSAVGVPGAVAKGREGQDHAEERSGRRQHDQPQHDPAPGQHHRQVGPGHRHARAERRHRVGALRERHRHGEGADGRRRPRRARPRRRPPAAFPSHRKW